MPASSLPAGDDRGRALGACLLPAPESLGSAAEAFRRRLLELAARWSAGGFSAPESWTPGHALGDDQRPPDPAAADPDSLDLLEAAHPDDVRGAAEWAAGARFRGVEHRAALTVLTDVLAIGAAPILPAFLSERHAEAVLGSFPGASTATATLWRPVAGRSSSDLWSAILWNRIAGDPQELHAGPEYLAAAVAVAEAQDRPLAELLDAVVVGSGVGSWHRDLVGGAMEQSGVHSPGALAPVAAAAAVGRLIGASAEALELGLRRASALTPRHPYRAFTEGASAKLFYGAFGQLLGAIAALGDEKPLGPLPPAPPARGERRPGVAPFDPRPASRTIHNAHLKKFPGSRAVQSALAAIEKLPRVAPEAVESVLVETYPFSATVSGWSRPERGPVAMQSHIPTAVALMIEARGRRESLLADHYPRALGPETIRLADRVTVRPHEFGDPDAPASRRVRWARVTIRQTTGPDLSISSGPPFAPPPPGAVRDRFARLARGATVRDPHQFAGSTPVRELFRAAPPRPEAPPEAEIRETVAEAPARPPETSALL